MKGKKILWGVFLVLCGVLLVAGQFGALAGFSVLTIVLGVMLGAVAIKSLVSFNPYGFFLSAALLYIVFQKPLGWLWISPWILILAALLIASGVSVFVRPKWSYTHTTKYTSYSDSRFGHSGGYSSTVETQESTAPEENSGSPAAIPAITSGYSGNDNNPAVNVSFGGVSKYLHADAFVGGDFSVSFGGLEVYFDEVKFAGESAHITVSCNFGGMELYIPKEWNVVDDVTATLGATEIDRSRSRVQPGSPTLYISGSVQFGAVEIKYV